MTVVIPRFCGVCFGVAITGFTSLGDIADATQKSDAKGLRGFGPFSVPREHIRLLAVWMVRTHKTMSTGTTEPLPDMGMLMTLRDTSRSAPAVGRGQARAEIAHRDGYRVVLYRRQVLAVASLDGEDGHAKRSTSLYDGPAVSGALNHLELLGSPMCRDVMSTNWIALVCKPRHAGRFPGAASVVHAG
jgi:hypothetical protein